MRMVELLPRLAPEAWRHWCELAPKLAPRWGGDWLALLEYNGLVHAAWSAGDEIARQMVGWCNAMLVALVEAGMARRVTGRYLRGDYTQAQLVPSHWRALAAGGAGRLHEVLDLAHDRLLIATETGQHGTLTGIDLDPPDEPPVPLTLTERRIAFVVNFCRRGGAHPEMSAPQAFKALRDTFGHKHELLQIGKRAQSQCWTEVKARKPWQ